MKLIVGIGNPGSRYERTRHNLGFRVVQALARDCGIRFKKESFLWRGEGMLGGQEFLLVLPQTFVNRSGAAVQAVLSEHHLSLKDLLVVCDDLALPLGTLRFRASGSPGGHKGLESIVTLLASQAFARLRLGIGLVPEGIAWEEFVLGNFTRQEALEVEAMISESVQAVRLWVEKGVQG